MKRQSFRLLSMLMALVMLFGALSVLASAEKFGLVKTAVTYDSVDDAVLTADQVATLVFDMVDTDLLAGMETLDLSVAGSLRLDSINHALYDLESIETGFLWAIAKALLGDLGDFNFNAIENGSNAYQRSATTGTNLTLLSQLVLLLGDNKNILKKIVYGIGTDNGLSLGVASSAVGEVDLDIPNLLYGLVFDNLLYRSYAYPGAEDATLYATTPTVYKEWEKQTTHPFTSADTMINTAIFNLLTTPQDKKWTLNTTTGLMEQKWDINSKIVPTVAASAVNLTTNSFFTLLDNCLQLAYNTLGIAPLNNDLKQVLMEATGAEFIEIENPSAALQAEYTSRQTSVTNYFVDAATFKYNGNWYFVDNVNKGIDIDEDDVTDKDANGVDKTELVRRFFKADISDVDELFNVVNWDYAFTTSTINFAANKTTYGSLFGSLNHLLYTILDTVFAADVKTDIAAFLNDGQGFYIDGANSNLTANLLRLAKYILCTYTEKLFGKNRANIITDGVVLQSFVNTVKAFTTVEDLAAYIAVPLMKDILPEMILPATFTSGLQVEQIGALALREALSDLTPVINYDSVIFASGSLTASTGRVLATHTQAEWQNIVLNMALSLAMIYLDNETNINIDTAGITTVMNRVDSGSKTGNGWKALLEEIVDWGVGYVGSGSSSLLVGCDPTTLTATKGTYSGNAFTILSTVLNKILPLGFICGSSVNASGVLNVDTLFWQLFNAVCNLDVPSIISLFGRNTGNSNNILNNTNIITQIIAVLNRVLGVVFNDTTILQSTASLDAALINQANLQGTISDLLAALNTRKTPLLACLLPLLSKFISDWGGEQVIGNPDCSLAQTVSASAGTITDSAFTISNGSKGVWRGYMNGSTRAQDEQYTYDITGITATTVGGTGTVSGITPTTGSLAFGASLSVTFDAASINAANGANVLFTISYKVKDEAGAYMANGQVFTLKKYVYLSYNPTNNGATAQVITKGDKLQGGVLSPLYIPIESGATDIPAKSTCYFADQYTNDAAYKKPKGKITYVSGTNYGIGITARGEEDLEKESTVYWQQYTVNATTYNAAAATMTPGTTLNIVVNLLIRDRVLVGTGGSANANGTITMKFYSSEAMGKLKGLTDDETGKTRISSDYNTTTCYATEVLKSTAGTEEDPQMTNFTTTGVDPDTGLTVTTINGATAWTNYTTALNNAIRGAWQVWNANSVYDQLARYEALRIAANDINVCKKTPQEIAAAGGQNNDTAITAVKTLYTTQQDAIKSYKDYMLYRLNRYNDWAGDANGLIKTFNAANAAVDLKVFPYKTISLTDLNALLAIDGTYTTYINALLEDRTEAQIAASNATKADAQETLATNYNALDINQINNMLTKTYARLLPREGGTITAYLSTEINSALAVYGSAATNAAYSQESWDNYLAKLADAQAELAAPQNNGTVFDAKYYLQRAVNDLIPISQAADYSDLNSAIAQAQTVLANLDLYEHSTDDGIKSVGKLLAALGYKIDETDLFPNGALNVQAKVYDLEDQDRIDNAETVLRLALADVRYIGTGVTNNNPNSSTETKETGSGSQGYYAFVPAGLGLTSLTNNTYIAPQSVPAGVTNVTPQVVTPGSTNAGTGTVVTYYGTATISGVPTTIPVASYSVVVIGDINGDSVIDSLDAMLADLTVNHAEDHELTGAYLKAALADAATAAGGIVTIAALQEILNIAVGK